MLSIQKLIAALLIASTPLSGFASTDEVESCDSVFWSKASPNKAVLIRHLEHGNTAFLTCTGHLDPKKKKHVMDSCRPIEPERQFYTQEELKANWFYLIKRSATDNLGPVLSDTALGFFTAELAAGVIGQGILAEGVATLGERIAAIGPRAARAVSSTGKTLGGGVDLFKGSRTLANDQAFRFYPAYVTAAMSFVGAGIKNIKNGEFNHSMQRASSMSPFGYRSYSCGPHELHQEFTGLGIRTPTIDEYETTLRTALKMSQDRPDSWVMIERKRKELARSDAEKTADQSAPELAPTVASNAFHAAK